MPKYPVERQFQVGQEQMPEVGGRSRRLVEEHFPETTWTHSHVAGSAGGFVLRPAAYRLIGGQQHVLNSTQVFSSLTPVLRERRRGRTGAACCLLEKPRDGRVQLAASCARKCGVRDLANHYVLERELLL